MSKIVGKICDKHTELNGLRYSGTNRCCLCQNESTKAYYQRNKEKHKAIVAKYYKEVTKKKQKENPDHFKAINKKFRDKNPEKTKQWSKNWRQNNLQKHRDACRQSWIRRYSLLGAQHIAKKYSKELIDIYKNCPEGYEVDHIVPLRGKQVNGLHVPWNLQYLPASENKRKGNKYQEHQ